MPLRDCLHRKSVNPDSPPASPASMLLVMPFHHLPLQALSDPGLVLGNSRKVALLRPS